VSETPEEALRRAGIVEISVDEQKTALQNKPPADNKSRKAPGDDRNSEAGRADTEDGPSEVADGVELERLAGMPKLEYARARKDVAKRLGVTVILLDAAVTGKRQELGLSKTDARQGHALDLRAPEPWPEQVDGAELLESITAAIKRYVVIAEHAARACALWTLHSYLIDCFLISPRLTIRSAMPRCGKTTLLDVVSYLALRTLVSANVTAASVFRVIETCRPTLLIDEADTFLPGSDELRGVINSGHRKGGAVIRTVGDDHEPRTFSTYAACAIALIGKLRSRLGVRDLDKVRARPASECAAFARGGEHRDRVPGARIGGVLRTPSRCFKVGRAIRDFRAGPICIEGVKWTTRTTTEPCCF
jgi:hypothetical protein